ncbi:MAG: hypothetical protein EPN25_07945 [Nitrospirae bacterium]|nr:MAG: hypothetical protein EPN25_07945 [Nitrospirota bacterium]
MKIITNEKGVALVMVLIFALIGLAVVSGMMFMITQGTIMSGSNKQFRSADEAGLGGTEIAVEYIKGNAVPPIGLPNVVSGNVPCLSDKIGISRGSWTSSSWVNCAGIDISLDPTAGTDMTYTVTGTEPGTTYTVFTKIVDTVKGNTDASGVVTGGKLGGEAVTASNSGIVTPPTYPSMYRVEVQTQSMPNTRERSRYSLLYAY